ncbi:predicted protein [Naegleria gruberi]|uniref:Predicted protein n=1 Tax=Naegleria gruberi TaxID=5762 RepID=D2VSZ9_NAEGR|nr:uncharacterized protein NAEGRDRAFT_52014 [Naegleria gruberi]EFC39992.1 predicted protein [Naegleria gruberi]|eukprot:XP_002672736.1 predicted protein [Naegleria gruberi strain NEG-M]
MPPHSSLFQTIQSHSDETLRNRSTTRKTTTSRERESRKCPLCMRSRLGSSSEGCVHAKALIQKTNLKAPFIGLHNSRLLDRCPTSSVKFPEFKALIEKTIEEFTDLVPANDFTIDKKPYREMLNRHFYQKINDLAIIRGIFPRDSNDKQSWSDDAIEYDDENDEITIVNKNNTRIDQPSIPPARPLNQQSPSNTQAIIPTKQPKIKPASKPKTPKQTTVTPPLTTPVSFTNTQPKSQPSITTPSNCTKQLILDVDSPIITTPKITYPTIKPEKVLTTTQSTPNLKKSDDSFLKPSPISPVSVRKTPTITTPARRSSIPSTKQPTYLPSTPQKIQKQKIMLKNNRTKKRELMMLSQSDFNSLQSLGEALVQNWEEKPPINQIKFKYPENGKKIHVNTTGLEVIKDMFGKYDLLEFSIGKKQRYLTTPNKVHNM